MSVKLMSLVFDAVLPKHLPYQMDGEERKAKASTVKLMLLAYADHANDEGEGSYPGYRRLRVKTALTDRGIANLIEALKQNDFMTFEGVSKLNTHSYRINKEKLQSLVLNPVQKAQKRVSEPASEGFLNPVQKGSEPASAEPSNTSNTPLTVEEVQQANNLVDAIIANGKKAKYENRNKIPEPYLPLCDLYVELTGQKPTKRVLTDWLASFSDWVSEGLQVEDIRAAYEFANRPNGGFPVSRPGSLTNTAVMLKSKKSTEPAAPARKVFRAESPEEKKKYVPVPPELKERMNQLFGKVKHVND